MDRMKPGSARAGMYPRAAFLFLLAVSTAILSTCDNPVDILSEVKREVMLSNDRFLTVTDTDVPLIAGTSYFSPTGRITFTFDRALDPSSISSDTIRAIDDSGLIFDWDEDGIEYLPGSKILKVRFLPYLEVDEDFTIRLDGIEGADGSDMADPVSIALRTGLVTTGSIAVTGLMKYPEYKNFAKSASLEIKLQITDAFEYVKYGISLDGGSTWENTPAWNPRGSGSFTETINTGGEGEFTILARFWGNTDPAESGKTDGVDSALSLVVDVTAPTVAAGADVYANAQRSLAPSIVEAYPLSYAWTVVSGTGAILYSPSSPSTDVAGTAEGNKVLRLTVTDRAGNAASDDVGFWWDTVAPVFDLGENVYAKAIKNFAPAITDTGGSGILAYAWDGDGLIISAPAAASTNVSAAADSKHALSLRVTDKAGNSRSDSLTFYWDTIVPPAPSTPDLATADDTGWSATDNLTRYASALTFSGTSEAYATIQVRTASTVFATTTATSGGVWTLDAAIATSATPYALYAVAIDRAGNIGANSATISLTVDTVYPAAPSTPDLAEADDTGWSPTDNKTSVSAGLTFSGTGAADGSRLYLSNGADLGYVANAATWTMDLSLAQGSSSLRAAAEDGAGNRTYSAASATVIVDSTAPTVTTFTIGSGNPAATNAALNTLYITASDAGSGIYQVAYGNLGESWSAFEAYASSKAWTLQDKAGTRTAYIQVVDAAGNTRVAGDSILLNARIVVSYSSLLIEDDGDMDILGTADGEIYYSFALDGVTKLQRTEAQQLSVGAPRSINQPQLLASGGSTSYTIYEDPSTGAFTMSGTVYDDDAPLADDYGNMQAITYSAPFADVPSASRSIVGDVAGRLYYSIDFQNP